MRINISSHASHPTGGSDSPHPDRPPSHPPAHESRAPINAVIAGGRMFASSMASSGSSLEAKYDCERVSACCTSLSSGSRGSSLAAKYDCERVSACCSSLSRGSSLGQQSTTVSG